MPVAFYGEHRCQRCAEIKPRYLFDNRPRYPGGRDPYCQDCREGVEDRKRARMQVQTKETEGEIERRTAEIREQKHIEERRMVALMANRTDRSIRRARVGLPGWK